MLLWIILTRTLINLSYYFYACIFSIPMSSVALCVSSWIFDFSLSCVFVPSPWFEVSWLYMFSFVFDPLALCADSFPRLVNSSLSLLIFFSTSSFSFSSRALNLLAIIKANGFNVCGLGFQTCSTLLLMLLLFQPCSWNSSYSPTISFSLCNLSFSTYSFSLLVVPN